MKTLKVVGTGNSAHKLTEGIAELALELVNERANETAPTSASERLFAHWVFMLGKNPRRCALGPARRKVIEKARMLYDEETLMLAIEGCAASAWHAGENDRGAEFNDLALIFRDEAHVERFCADGERLRARAAAAAQPKAQVINLREAPDPAAKAAALQALRQLAMRISGRG